MKLGSELSERERRYLEHVQRAKSRGQSLAQYCREAEISVHTLYGIRHQMRRRGLPHGEAGAPDAGPRGGFLPVRLTATPASAGIVCRLRHPSGWVIECASWPAADWMAELIEAHDAAA